MRRVMSARALVLAHAVRRASNFQLPVGLSHLRSLISYDEPEILSHSVSLALTGNMLTAHSSQNFG
jgi:hypothetical protein